MNRTKWYEVWGKFHQVYQIESVVDSMVLIRFTSKCCNQKFSINTIEHKFLSRPLLQDRCTGQLDTSGPKVNDTAIIVKFGKYLDKTVWGVCQQSGKLVGVKICGETNNMITLVERHSGYNFSKELRKIDVCLSKKDALIMCIGKLSKTVEFKKTQLNLYEKKLNSLEQQLKVVNDNE